MQSFPKTFVIRHRRENLKKCSLRGLEARPDFTFFTYPPKTQIPINPDFLLLTLNGTPLSPSDKNRELLILDGTWRYATTMKKYVDSICTLEERSIPQGWITAYPRRQEDCEDPSSGLASIEAIAIAFLVMGRDPSGLFSHYFWKDKFLKINDEIGSLYEYWPKLKLT